ncbi:protein of unknown function [Aliiroseovarius halocynthiae]|uniref:DUF4864 domain-containing protein n=1 Tax=Aliiroseovarius halocynthiae TaxID=985055 RepID=A0A545SZS8_9RHOB|nr:DUF4864 domain-containing protein [Aliiroseovarius halocynthiae]TQV70475.1 DUF4864 domain-containing protein [Aliiroseovarius halocynthiae]SMR81803.1 protein of unknown function [Aliiroseovarius halocynthiae]
MRFITLLLGLTLWCAPTYAQDQSIEGVITSQIDAFSAQDVNTAFSYASPSIQQLFGTAEAFGDMVQNGYPMVRNPAELEYVDQITNGSLTLQRLRIQDQLGQDHWFAYEMIQIDGDWRINGVYRIAPIGLSV